MNNIKNPSPNVMNTWTGRQFDPLHMQPSDVSLEDIAHALSLLCRGGGHLDRFYSVGQHCINCAGEARARGWSDRLVLACLLHDASEAYISDIIRPVKIHLDNYRNRRPDHGRYPRSFRPSRPYPGGKCFLEADRR